MPDRLTSMRLFLALAETGTLTAAGRRLGISPTMAARHLDALEAHLGTPLAVRSTRAVRLTEAGRRYAELCRRVLDELAEGEAAIAGGGPEPRGRLRMTVPVTLGTRLIAPSLAAFHRRFPAVVVELDLSDRRVDVIAEGFELAVRIGEPGAGPLHQKRLGEVRAALAAAPAYLAARGRPRRLADLAGHECLGYTLSEQVPPGHWPIGTGRPVQVRGPVLANNGDALAEAAAAGMGVVLLPEFVLAPYLADGRLVRLALEDARLPDLGGIWALWPATRAVPARVQAMIGHLGRVLRSGAPAPGGRVGG